MGSNTVAAARANATATLNVITSPDSVGSDFRTQITNEELGLHRFFNDDVVQLAEQLANHTAARDRLSQAIEENRQIQEDYLATPSTGMAMPGANAGMRIAEQERILADEEQIITAIEEEIIAEFEHIENEFARVANRLNDEAFQQAYIDAVRADVRWQGDLAFAVSQYRAGNATPQQEQLAMIYGDLVPYAMPRQPRDYPPEIVAIHDQMRAYNAYWVDYRLLQAGGSIRVARIPWGQLIMGGIVLIIAEVVTAGAINVVIASTAGASRLVAASRIGTRIGNQITRRYNSLPPAIQTKLDDLFHRRQPTQRAEPETPGNNTTTQRTTQATVRNCTCR